MSILEPQIQATLLPGLSIPPWLSQLFDWIEVNNFYIDTDAGRIGTLFPEDNVFLLHSRKTIQAISFCLYHSLIYSK